MQTVAWKFAEADSVYEVAATDEHGRLRPVNRPEDVYKAFRPTFEGRVTEGFGVIALSASNRPVGFKMITEGILNSSLVHPREVFRAAIDFLAASIIVCHNHPSGNPEPSSEDITLTRQLKEAGKILGIPIHDHVIFAGDTFTSLAERGDM